MARPRNEQLKREIARVAQRQFEERGYDATSYASIAEECGISRNLVQYHYPKKQLLAIAYMEGVLARSRTELGLDGASLVGDYDAILAIGVRFFQKLLATEGTRAFLLDIIRSRDLTEEVLAFNASWAIERAVGGAQDVPAPVMRSVRVHMGGFYELLYHCLKTGEPMDVQSELASVVNAFARAL